MFQTTVDPATLRRELRARHFRFLGEGEARILALLAEGYTNSEMAALLGVAPVTVRRRVTELSNKVLAVTPVPNDRDKLRAWVNVHLTCCAVGVHQMIELDQHLA
jgi:DNA-binding NarL/FixJ family response regulator